MIYNTNKMIDLLNSNNIPVYGCVNLPYIKEIQARNPPIVEAPMEFRDPLPKLPQEIWEKIYKKAHSLCLREVHDQMRVLYTPFGSGVFSHEEYADNDEDRYTTNRGHNYHTYGMKRYNAVHDKQFEYHDQVRKNTWKLYYCKKDESTTYERDNYGSLWQNERSWEEHKGFKLWYAKRECNEGWVHPQITWNANGEKVAMIGRTAGTPGSHYRRVRPSQCKPGSRRFNKARQGLGADALTYEIMTSGKIDYTSMFVYAKQFWRYKDHPFPLKYKDFEYKELQALAKTLGVKANGKRNEMIARIMKAPSDKL